jgi:hypothetical protein
VQDILRTDAVHPEKREKAPSKRELNRQIQKTLYVPFVGGLGVLIAQSAYPLLDRGALSVFAVLFLLPFGVHIVSAVRKRLAADIGRLRRVYSYCGAVLIGFAAFLGLNGWLDRAPAQFVRTSIVHKHVTRGRSSVAHVLDVSSWRRGHDEEHLQVSSAQYRSMESGQEVVIEVHGGRFGLPWYGSIALK